MSITSYLAYSKFSITASFWNKIAIANIYYKYK